MLEVEGIAKIDGIVNAFIVDVDSERQDWGTNRKQSSINAELTNPAASIDKNEVSSVDDVKEARVKKKEMTQIPRRFVRREWQDQGQLASRLSRNLARQRLAGLGRCRR